MKTINATGVALAAALACTLTSVTLHAAPYPDKPIRVIVPYPPGGNLDTTARAIANAMGKSLKQTLVVENMGGAAGSIGAANVARANPDGYTVLATTIVPLVVNPTLMPGVKTTLKDFTTVGMMAVVPSVLEVNSKSERFKGQRDFKGFIDYARSHPGDVSVGHSGNGTTNHIVAVQMEKQFGVKFNSIPYKGSAPALTDLLGGQIDAMVDQLTSSQPHITQGNFTALAVTGAQRAPGLPDVATVAELTGSDFNVVTYSAMLTPANTPEDVRQILNKAMQEAVSDPAVRKQLELVGAQVVPGTIDQASAIITDEQGKLQSIIDSGMLKPE